MKNELRIINQQEVLGKEFKIYGTVENPLFLAKDVAEWIDYSKSNGKYKISQMISTVDDDEKGIYIIDTPGGVQNTWFLTEDGLYEVLMQSRKPIAKQFKKEVKKILKQIRQTGGYIPVKEEDSDAEIMARALLVAQKTIERKNQRIMELEPKAEVYDRFIDQSSTWGFRELRKELESTLNITIKENEFKEVLKEKGWIGTTLRALAYAIRNQYMVTKDVKDKFDNLRTQDRFTEKARKELLDFYKNN